MFNGEKCLVHDRFVKKKKKDDEKLKIKYPAILQQRRVHELCKIENMKERNTIQEFMKKGVDPTRLFRVSHTRGSYPIIETLRTSFIQCKYSKILQWYKVLTRFSLCSVCITLNLFQFRKYFSWNTANDIMALITDFGFN